ncbi:hypothetical protein A3860_11240 [Niastella vici]|uniref:DUF4919 domain-containing protein n=1 Tax=Niastella vici TaxID=1703345 RepID=A0A1V9FFL5_9BACT|nr:hypothetical protein [Niastella vici]OQP57130.1 hypothetical protein A3860_11240 [Niastella vici]
MKTICLSLAFILGLFACSSPGTKTKKQDVLIKDTNASTVANTSEEPVDSLTPYPEDDLTVPPYGLDTVKALIDKIKFVDDPDGGEMGTKALDANLYVGLSFNEKFTYHMIHAESYSQNCAILPVRTDEANRIYGHLPHIFGDFSWSERQLKFFTENRDAVEQLMKPLIQINKKIGGNFREAIVEMNAKELIPYLIEFYNKEKKDHYVLTVLMLLMKENKYPEFMSSTSYKKLYDFKDEQYENEYGAYLVYNKANEALIIQRATNFYNGLQAK